MHIKNRMLTELLASNDIVIPALLGKKIRFENNEQVYLVVATRWRSREIILKEVCSEKMRTLSGSEFFNHATSIDD